MKVLCGACVIEFAAAVALLLSLYGCGSSRAICRPASVLGSIFSTEVEVSCSSDRDASEVLACGADRLLSTRLNSACCSGEAIIWMVVSFWRPRLVDGTPVGRGAKKAPPPPAAGLLGLRPNMADWSVRERARPKGVRWMASGLARSGDGWARCVSRLRLKKKILWKNYPTHSDLFTRFNLIVLFNEHSIQMK